MRQVNVKLEEFSEGGAWPPGDDSWFWDTDDDDDDDDAGAPGALAEDVTGPDPEVGALEGEGGAAGEGVAVAASDATEEEG